MHEISFIHWTPLAYLYQNQIEFLKKLLEDPLDQFFLSFGQHHKGAISSPRIQSLLLSLTQCNFQVLLAFVQTKHTETVGWLSSINLLHHPKVRAIVKTDTKRENP